MARRVSSVAEMPAGAALVPSGRRGGKLAQHERQVAEAEAAGLHVHVYGGLAEARCINGECDLTAPVLGRSVPIIDMHRTLCRACEPGEERHSIPRSGYCQECHDELHGTQADAGSPQDAKAGGPDA
ncbi:MAG: hypothetical protein JWM02_3677 [Frankiales bacterium]|nr:hypothetical protein [Frankiales bacterium]